VRGVLAVSVVAVGLAGLCARFAATADGAVRTLDARQRMWMRWMAWWSGIATAAGAEC
jgi:hypothetical protein